MSSVELGTRYRGAIVRSRRPACTTLAWLALGIGLTRAGSVLAADDNFRGAVVGDARQIGLGGAYSALVQGARGIAANPAAAALRLAHDIESVGWDVGVDASLGAAQGIRSGAALKQSPLRLGSVAAALQFDHAGVGFVAEGHQQALREGAPDAGLEPTSFTGRFGVIHAAVGFGFAQGQLVLAGGPRLGGVSFGPSNASRASVTTLGYELGALWAPRGRNLRFAFVGRSELQRKRPYERDEPWLSEQLRLPWELALGAAFQSGARPLNHRSQTVEDYLAPLRSELQQRALARQSALERSASLSSHQRAQLRAQSLRDEALWLAAKAEARRILLTRLRTMPRRYVLFSAELRLIGPLHGGGLPGASRPAQGEPEIASRPALSPHVAMESELWPDWLRVRTGAYLEPAVRQERTPRLHATWGADIKLFQWDAFGWLESGTGWRCSLALDRAYGYINTAAGIGFWH